MVVNDHNKTEQSMENDLATQNDEIAVEPAETEQSSTELIAEELAKIRGRNTEAADKAAPVAGETEQQKTERAREKDGKFAKNEAKTQQVGKDVQPASVGKSGNAQSVDQPAAVTDQQPATPATTQPSLQAPNGLTAEGKAEFAKASPALQREIVKRENDFHNYYHKEVAPLKQAAQYGQELYKAIQPYEQTIRNMGGTAAQAVNGLFAADNLLRNGSPQEKVRAFAELAKGYGIDLSQGLPEQPQYDPNVEFLQRQNQTALQAAQQANQRIQQLEARQEQERQASEQAQLNSTLEQISQGKPHFKELGVAIGSIMEMALKQGKEMTWDEAYEAAMWQSPTHRAELLAKQQEAASAAAAQKRADDASKAKAARLASSTNVAKRGTLQTQGAVGDSQEFIREELARMRTSR